MDDNKTYYDYIEKQIVQLRTKQVEVRKIIKEQEKIARIKQDEKQIVISNKKKIALKQFLADERLKNDGMIKIHEKSKIELEKKVSILDNKIAENKIQLDLLLSKDKQLQAEKSDLYKENQQLCIHNLYIRKCVYDVTTVNDDINVNIRRINENLYNIKDNLEYIHDEFKNIFECVKSICHGSFMDDRYVENHYKCKLCSKEFTENV
jgi:hypothetical protein